MRHVSEIKRSYIVDKFKLKNLDKSGYTIQDKTEAKRKRPPTMRGLLMLLRTKLKTFYYYRLRKKSLRKLLAKRRIKKYQLYNTSKYRLSTEPLRFISPAIAKGSTGAMIESRIDVVLYRLNFIYSIMKVGI